MIFIFIFENWHNFNDKAVKDIMFNKIVSKTFTFSAVMSILSKYFLYLSAYNNLKTYFLNTSNCFQLIVCFI